MPLAGRCYTITPLFIVDDVVRSAEYYRDVLGFGFDRYWGEPPWFVMVGRDNVEVMLSSAAGPGHVHPNRTKHHEVGWDAYVRVTAGDPLYREFKAKGAKIIREPEVTFYQMKEFEVEDCNGYVLCFGQDVGREEASSERPSATGAGAHHQTQQVGGSTMTKNGVKAVPDGYHTVTPAITVRGAAEAIEFYKKAFGAVETVRFPGPDGHSVMHAEIRIGDSAVMLGDEFPNMGGKAPTTLGGTCSNLMLYVEDVDAAFQKAVAAGARADMPPADMFWGDRYAKVTDPFGHSWSLGTHIEDVTPEECARRGQEFFARMAKRQG